MNAKEQTALLVRLQAVAQDVRRAEAVVAAAPGRIEEIEGRFRERNAEYVTVRDRHDELERDSRERDLELKTLEETHKKLMADLMQVQNQREYAALLKEIDTVKAKISGHEDKVLANMEELEGLRTELDSRKSHIDEERQVVERERAEVESDVQAAEATITQGRVERDAIESELPAPLLGSVRRVEQSRHGLFLVEVRDGTCQACYVRVRPQAFQEIKLGSRLHACGSCLRYLYYPPLLSESSGSDSTGDAPSAGAVHGG